LTKFGIYAIVKIEIGINTDRKRCDGCLKNLVRLSVKNAKNRARIAAAMLVCLVVIAAIATAAVSSTVIAADALNAIAANAADSI